MSPAFWKHAPLKQIEDRNFKKCMKIQFIVPTSLPYIQILNINILKTF